MKKTPKVSSWFLACVATFFTRAFLYSTWVSRGPEVKASLHLDNAQMGLFVMLYPLGGLIGVLFAGKLRERFGSSALTYVGFTVSALAFASLAFTVPAGNVVASSALLFVMGLPMSIADFITNYQATAVSARSTRTLMPAIHSAFGLGMMLGAGAANLFIGANVGLKIEYLVTAVIVLLPALWAAYIYPPESETASDGETAVKSAAAAKTRSPWTEARTLKIAVIGFMFIMAEMAAATWVPIALVDSGASGAEAAAAWVRSGLWLPQSGPWEDSWWTNSDASGPSCFPLFRLQLVLECLLSPRFCICHTLAWCCGRLEWLWDSRWRLVQWAMTQLEHRPEST